MKHMSDYMHLINNNLYYWSEYFESFAEAIRQKLNTLNCPQPSPTEGGGFCILGFIDNTAVQTCRPGGGPKTDGPGAQRNDANIQRAFYNGWKKNHGIKFQTVDAPNGMTIDIWGPSSIRHNDIETYNMSDINGKLAAVQMNNNYQYKIYGDSAYQYLLDSHIACRYDNATGIEVRLNLAMSACRECIEWNYGHVNLLFKYVDYAHGLKLRQQNVSSFFLNAVLIRNAYVTMNGCQTSEYFNCKPPSFENWVRI
jgi:hypothetical protein